jgi:two-component system chemotaxis response regulator CheY
MDSLIIEDDGTTRSILEKWLSDFGKVSSASNGEDGLELFDAALASGFPYDLICLDINMPGINGHQTLERLRGIEDNSQAQKPTKVLMITANGDSKSVMTAFKSQCDGYLVKPLGKVSFMSELNKLGFELN